MLSGITKQIEYLEKTLTDEGYESTAIKTQLNQLKSQIKASVLSDMETHKAELLNDIEIALLSRELPNRLLNYRIVMNDLQV